MAQIVSSVVIHRSVEDVFAFVNNFAAYSQWQSGVIAARMVSDGPLGSGSRIAETRRFFGRTTDMIWEVTTFQPPHTRGFKMEGAFPSTGVMTWESVPEGTRLRVEVTTKARGVLKLLEPLLARTVRQQNAKDFATLKQLLESNASLQDVRAQETIS